MEQLNAGSLGALIGTFTTECVHADTMAKIACMERTLTAFEAGNFEIESETGLIGMDQMLQTKISAPKAFLIPLNPILITQAELDINMSVSSSESSSTDIDSQTEVSGSASVGFGFWKASMSVKSSVGVKSSNRRASDQRSTCEAKVIMGQGEVPEGVSRLLDALLITVDKAMDINLELVDIQAQKLREESRQKNGGSDTTDTPTETPAEN